MKLNKPKFWETGHWFIPILLLPFSLIVLFLLFLKNKFTKPKKFNVSIICVGNIYIGGTGKTPTSILLANELMNSKKNPVILKKFYKNQIDEHGLIRNNFQNLILNKNRDDGILEAKKRNHDIIIMDDGFQDYRIKKDLNILCFNQNQLIGNGFILPAGPLREPLKSLQKAQVILINGQKDIKFENKLLRINQDLEVFYSSYVPINVNKFTNKNFIAVTGIGNPINFFDLLEKNKITIKKKLIFPDHYEFSKTDIKKIINLSKENNCEIIMTEKDYFKTNMPKNEIFQYLKVSLEINDKEKLIKTILKKI
tara:strand:- start:9771 stop:10700 length:930 start_codon:yes stop_codon:yes gene_type:complete